MKVATRAPTNDPLHRYVELNAYFVYRHAEASDGCGFTAYCIHPRDRRYPVNATELSNVCPNERIYLRVRPRHNCEILTADNREGFIVKILC